MHTYAINRSLKENKFHVSPIKINLERNETILISGRKTSNLDFLVSYKHNHLSLFIALFSMTRFNFDYQRTDKKS